MPETSTDIARWRRVRYGIPALALGAALLVPIGTMTSEAAEATCVAGKDGPYSQSFAESDTDWPLGTVTQEIATLHLQQFDSRNGVRRLLSAELTTGASGRQSGYFENFSPTAPQPYTYSRSWTVSTQLGGPPGTPLISLTNTFPTLTGTLPVTPEPGYHVDVPEESNSDTKVRTFTSADTEWGLFQGSGTFDIRGQGTGVFTNSNSGGNIINAVRTKAGFSASVTYTYDCAYLSVTKTVSGTPVPADWSFNFTISPAPADGSPATLTATKANPKVTFSGLVAGTAYSVAEAPSPGYTQSGVTCNSPTAIGGGTVECTANNTVIPTPINTPTPSPSNTGGECAVVGSDGEQGCKETPLDVNAAAADTVLSRGKWTKVVSSAHSTSVATVSESVKCYKSNGKKTTSGCSSKHGKSHSMKVKITGCKATTVKVTYKATPKDEYSSTYASTTWTRTWKVKAC